MRYLIIISLLIVSSCKAPAPDLAKSKQFVENLLSEIKSQNWDAAMEYYDNSFSKEDRTSKLKQISQGMGDIQNSEFVSSEENTDPGQASYLLLTYKISRSGISSKEQFKIINDEGKLFIVAHNIENWKE